MKRCSAASIDACCARLGRALRQISGAPPRARRRRARCLRGARSLRARRTSARPQRLLARCAQRLGRACAAPDLGDLRARALRARSEGERGIGLAALQRSARRVARRLDARVGQLGAQAARPPRAPRPLVRPSGSRASELRVGAQRAPLARAGGREVVHQQQRAQRRASGLDRIEPAAQRQPASAAR